MMVTVVHHIRGRGLMVGVNNIEGVLVGVLVWQGQLAWRVAGIEGMRGRKEGTLRLVGDGVPELGRLDL